MIKIGTQEQITDYFLSGDLSQSEIKKSDKSVFDMDKKLNKDAPYVKIGSAVDVILTGNEGDFQKQFYVAEEFSVSDTLKSVTKSIFFMALTDFEEYKKSAEEETQDFESLYGNLKMLPDDYILDACEENNYGQSYKPATRLKKVYDCQVYYTSLIRGEGKTILTKEEKETIQSVCNSLRENTRTSRFFGREFYKNQKDIDIYYQLPVYFRYEGMNCKSLLDIVIVENKPDGTIEVTPVDLKTTSFDTFYFPKQFVYLRYYIQAIFYKKAIREHIERLYPQRSIILHDFLFVVESTNNIGNPIVFEIEQDVLENMENHSKYNQPSFNELFERAVHYRENGKSVEKEVFESNVTPVKITIDGIKSARQRSEQTEW